jgi:hypothetical protein
VSEISVPDIRSPAGAEKIAQFGGEGPASPAAQINYNVPLPGAHEITRVVPIDLPEDCPFAPESSRLGASLLDLGVVQGDEDNLRGIDQQRLVRFYEKALPVTARPSLRHVARVGGDVEPLLTNVGNAGDDAAGLRMAKESMDLQARDRVVNARDDIEVERQRSASYLAELSKQQLDVVPPVASPRVQPTISMPIPSVGFGIQEVAVNPVARPQPRLALVETWELRAYLGDYGLGRTLQAFSLLPGERTTITVETWRTAKSTREDSSSIFDSSDVSAQSRFAASVSTETGAAFQDQGGWSLSVATSASVSANFFGLVDGTASAGTGFAANHQEASQRWSSSVSQAASEHANQVNNSRRQTVEAASSDTTASGTTTTTVREISNTNLRRVLNFVFRELNQTYQTYVVLRDIKLVFYNGRPGSLEIVPLPELGRLIRRHFAGNHVRIARQVLGLCAERLDSLGTPVPVLQYSHLDHGHYREWRDATLDERGELNFDDPLADGVRWRFKPGNLNGKHPRRINGLITAASQQVLRTDSVVVEALLGQADALDTYASALQGLDLMARASETDALKASTKKTIDALNLVAAQTANDQIEAWQKIFPDEPEIEVVPVAAVNNSSDKS